MQFTVVVCFLTVVKIVTSFTDDVCQDFCSEPGNRTDGIGECRMPSEMVDYEEDTKISCCFFTRINPIKYHWYVDGHQIDTDEGLKDGLILITNDLMGSYLSFPWLRAGQIFKKSTLNVTCKAVTSKGERYNSIIFYSEVCSDDYAKIIVDPESVEVLEGDAAQFNCAIIANDDANITWRMNGPHGIPKNSSRYEIIDQKSSIKCGNTTSTLRIENVQKDDFGVQFACELTLPTRFEVSNTAVIMTKEIEIITIQNYGLGIAIALSILTAILAILAILSFVFRTELLMFISNKTTAYHPI